MYTSSHLEASNRLGCLQSRIVLLTSKYCFFELMGSLSEAVLADYETKFDTTRLELLKALISSLFGISNQLQGYTEPHILSENP